MAWAHGRLVAEAFDVKAPIGHSYGDVEYYTRHLAGTTGRILEVGSGTGRILIRLLQAGLDVEGLEHSPDMIAVCRANCQERGLDPVLHEGDMTIFVSERAYETIIAPAGVINSLDGREDTMRALDCFRRSLIPGGRLIVDLEIPGMLTGPQPLRVWHRGDHLWAVDVTHSEFDPSAGQALDYVRYDRWMNGALESSELHIFRTQHWVPDQFADLLEKVGFTDIRVTANYDDNASPGKNDRDWTVHSVLAP